MTVHTFDANGNIAETTFTSPVTGKVWTVKPGVYELRNARIAAERAEEARQRREYRREVQAWKRGTR